MEKITFLVKGVAVEGRRRETRQDQGLASWWFFFSVSLRVSSSWRTAPAQEELLLLSLCHSILCFFPESHHKINIYLSSYFVTICLLHQTLSSTRAETISVSFSTEFLLPTWILKFWRLSMNICRINENMHLSWAFCFFIYLGTWRSKLDQVCDKTAPAYQKLLLLW